MVVRTSWRRDIRVEAISRRLAVEGWWVLGHSVEPATLDLFVTVCLVVANAAVLPAQTIVIPYHLTTDEAVRFVITQLKLRGCLSTSRQSA